MGKPEAPTPPNPYQTAAAQTGTSVGTGVANAFLNNVNQNTPDGSLRYDVTGTHSWTDPSTGQKYEIPTFTSTQNLSPQSQAIKSQLDAAKMNMAGMANTQSARVADWLSTPFDPLTGAPQAGNANAINSIPKAQTWVDPGDPMKTSFDPGANVMTDFGDAGDITKSYGPGDFSTDRSHVEDALMQRMNPQLARERGGIEQRLADQGIRYGSQAYASAMDDYNRQANDARFAAVGQAGSEQQRMMDMAAKRAGFENAAQQQQYEQLLGRAEFHNAGAGQQFGQNQQLAQFYNQGAGQQFNQNLQAGQFNNQGLAQQLNQAQSGFNAMNASRDQYLKEQYGMRNQPLNEITALMSGSAIQAPAWLQAPNNQIANTDIGGMINQNFAQQSQNYQSANQNWQAMMGGLLGAGGQIGAGYMKSDRRTKENITKMGTVFSAGGVADVDHDEIKKLPIYEYSYKDDPASMRHIGPMAQDVEKVDPRAVKAIGGVKHIDPKRVMGNILRAA